MSAELLPCPFCGATDLDYQQGSTFRWMLASCCGCGATCGETRVQTVGDGTPEQWWERAKADAIAAWNTRASLSGVALQPENQDHLAACAGGGATQPPSDEPVWIVNSLGELGVKVGDRLFFLYKGRNIEYGDPEIHKDSHKDGVVVDEEGDPMLYRIVGKREFGEVQYPDKWIRAGRSEHRYTEDLVWNEGLSFGKKEDGDWRPVPARGNEPPTTQMNQPNGKPGGAE